MAKFIIYAIKDFFGAFCRQRAALFWVNGLLFGQKEMKVFIKSKSHSTQKPEKMKKSTQD